MTGLLPVFAALLNEKALSLMGTTSLPATEARCSIQPKEPGPAVS
jgi:hypothetical protein